LIFGPFGKAAAMEFLFLKKRKEERESRERAENREEMRKMREREERRYREEEERRERERERAESRYREVKERIERRVEEIRRMRSRKEKEEQEGKTRKSRNEKDMSRKSGQKGDDNAYSESIPRAGPPLEEEFAGLQLETSENKPDYAAGQGMESMGKGKGKLEDWSDWERNQEYNCYYRYRLNMLGEWEYEYGPVLEDGGNQTNVC
jgi:hypothetical protein